MTQGFRCAEVERFGDAFVDGEFSDEDRAALEAHLGKCAACARRVGQTRAFKSALKLAAHAPLAPAGLRPRIVATLDAQEARARRSLGRKLAYGALPAAAAMVLAASLLANNHAHSSVVTDAIARYQRDLPVEVSGGDDQVRAWFAHKVDFAVRPPRLPPGAALVGGRLANVRDRQAAYLVYDVGGEKVAVLVFDPSDLPLDGSRRRQVGNRDVYVDGQRGYHVALFRDHDIGYAFTSDMDEDRMLQLVSSAVSR